MLGVRPPITTRKIQRESHGLEHFRAATTQTTNELFSSKALIKNSCVLLEDKNGIVVANIDDIAALSCSLTLCHLHEHPFAIFERKRVGIEEGQRKGPQTIEKAKQGAYVARTVSSL